MLAVNTSRDKQIWLSSPLYQHASRWTQDYVLHFSDIVQSLGKELTLVS
jgi:hypothetical protein